jgi:hypothetical protein
MELQKTCDITRISLIPCYNNKHVIDNDQKIFDDFIDKLEVAYPQLIIIIPNKIICNTTKCFTSIKWYAFIFSGGYNSHLNEYGSTLIGELYLKKFGNPLGLPKTTNKPI